MAFDVLTGLFDRVGLWTNVRKTVGMMCRPCQEAGVRAEKAYTRRMMGEGGGLQGVSSIGASGAGTIPGMQEGSGKGVTGDAPPNPARGG